MAKSIRQTVTFKARPSDVYALLMDSKKHSGFTGGRARISNKPGGNISAYDGYITGRNITLVENRLIVQEWHARDWEEGHISLVKFVLTKHKSGTRLTFVHSGVPEKHYTSIKQGWKDFYWEPMKRALQSK